jgi:hypothetical protein
MMLRLVILLIALVSVSVPSIAAGPVADRPEVWFEAPYQLPHDVFDLHPFDRHRSAGKLDVVAAMTDLGALSDTDLPSAQHLFDVLAWKMFVAMNWAAADDGQPDASKGFADATSPRVWEHWKQNSSIFLPHGAKPDQWAGATASESLDRFKAGWRMATTIDQGKQAFSGPLIDQNGKWIHYISLVNRTEFDYLVSNKLYSQECQAAFLRSHQISFPQGDDARYGAIEVKLAWKDLTPAEEHSGRFLVRKLPVVEYRPATDRAEMSAHESGRSANAMPAQPKLHTVGLIGMHIAMRTRSSPQWIWSTFEQVDNTRLNSHHEEASNPLPPRPSLSNPDNPFALVEANVLPGFNAANGVQDWDETRPIPPVEVLRLVPPLPGTEKVNDEVQSFLRGKGSVLRFYELIGTQWPTHPEAPAIAGGEQSAPESIARKMPGRVVPVFLINSTMETYFQRGLQPAGPLEQDNRLGASSSTDTKLVFGTESCVGCHYSAGAVIDFRQVPGKAKTPIYGENANEGSNGNANFSWLLQIEAQSNGTDNCTE